MTTSKSSSAKNGLTFVALLGKQLPNIHLPIPSKVNIKVVCYSPQPDEKAPWLNLTLIYVIEHGETERISN